MMVADQTPLILSLSKDLSLSKGHPEPVDGALSA